MAKIKSTLEIALERAASFGGRDQDEEARQEAAQKGLVVARKIFAGDLPPADAARELASLEPGPLEAAKLKAGETLLEPLPAGRQLVMPALAALFAGTPQGEELLSALEQSLNRLHQATVELSRELADELLSELAAKGIEGPALRANPEAHPQFEQRAQKALSSVLAALEKAKARFLSGISSAAG